MDGKKLVIKKYNTRSGSKKNPNFLLLLHKPGTAGNVLRVVGDLGAWVVPLALFVSVKNSSMTISVVEEGSLFFTTIVETVVVVVVVGEARVVMIERVVVVAADVVVDEVVVIRMRGRWRTTGLLPSPVLASTGLESGLKLCLFLARETIKTS